MMPSISQSTHGEQEIAEIGFIDPATTDLLLLPRFLTTEKLHDFAKNGGPTRIVSNL